MNDAMGKIDENVSEYRNAVKFLMDHKYKGRIHNSTPIQAACHIAEFLDHAKSYVKILCKQLSKSVYDNDFLIDSLKNALSRGIKVIVIIQRDKPDSEKFLEVFKLYGGNIYLAKNKAKESKINFSVMDKNAIRYEKSNDHCEAITELNTRTAGKYLKLFDKIIRNTVEELQYAN